jgi:hypothetical protein
MAKKRGQPAKKVDQGGQRASMPEPRQEGMHGTTGTASQPSEGNSPSRTGKAQPAGRTTKSGM